MGAAYLAGLAVGYWKSKEDVVKNWSIDRVFEPRISEEERDRKLRGWKKAVRYAFRLGQRGIIILGGGRIGENRTDLRRL